VGQKRKIHIHLEMRRKRMTDEKRSDTIMKEKRWKRNNNS
jgi:hypothetical protein